jgi:uncharacterized protein YlxW (UPF0749 family)
MSATFKALEVMSKQYVQDKKSTEQKMTTLKREVNTLKAGVDQLRGARSIETFHQ